MSHITLIRTLKLNTMYTITFFLSHVPAVRLFCQTCYIFDVEFNFKKNCILIFIICSVRKIQVIADYGRISLYTIIDCKRHFFFFRFLSYVSTEHIITRDIIIFAPSTMRTKKKPVQPSSLSTDTHVCLLQKSATAGTSTEWGSPGQLVS